MKYLFALMFFVVLAVPAQAAPAGRIVDLHTGQSLTPAQLLEQTTRAERLLVGEKHDNPAHHAIELWLAEQLATRRSTGAHLLEMLVPSQQAAVTALQANPTRLWLPEDIAWSKGWDWTLYGPLLRHLMAAPTPLLAANLDRAEIMAIYQNPPPLNGTHSNTAALREQLSAEIRDSHCGLLPEAQIPAMLAVQQQRDRRMAEALLAAPTPALLIAGAFHARKDRGVPLHVQDLAPAKLPRVLLLAEEGAEVSAAQADWVWFVDPLPEQDYCAELRAKHSQ